ncbi:MAG: hypothetical protein ACAH95_15860 [Fimbriimonas sp.]
MKTKWIPITVLAALALAPLVAITVTRSGGSRELQEQLRLAQTEGIPLNGSEYAAMIKPAELLENAAPLYQRLKTMRPKGNIWKADVALLNAPSAANVKVAKQVLADNLTTLKTVERAADLRRCWFNRNWDPGAAVLLPEYADMKGAAKLLSLRGSVAANEGRVEDAIADAKRVISIAKHSGEEGHSISRLVAESIYAVGMTDLATWAHQHRETPAYRHALASLLDSIPKPDLRSEHASDLFMLLTMIDFLKTERGRRDVGLQESDISKAEAFMPLLVDQNRAKAEIVRAARLHWTEVAKPVPDRAVLAECRSKTEVALRAFPTAANLYSMLFDGGPGLSFLRTEGWASRRLAYTAVLRALDGEVVPKKIKTADLRSPYDSKPLSYRFDGKRMSFLVSGWSDSSGPVKLLIPPDKE